MKLLAHRGYWNTIEEKNTLSSMTKAFENNWGVETDIRDYVGSLVISHDMPNEKAYTLEQFLVEYKKQSPNNCLALNIKADGLSDLLCQFLVEHKINNYFVFDMSIPETLRYLNLGMQVYVRESEYDTINELLYSKTQGIWLDAFINEWYTVETIIKHTTNNKKVAIVSPELHSREYEDFWAMLKLKNIHKNENVLLCTDLPIEATKYFEL